VTFDHKMKILQFTLAALVISGIAHADGIDIPPGGLPSGMAAFILTYGTYTGVQRDSTNHMAGGFTDSGVKTQILLHQSENINARAGTVIGVEFGIIRTVTNLNDSLTFEITPPRIIKSLDTGSTTNRFIFTRTIAQTQENPFIGFSFEKDWEMESGEWLFKVRYGDTVLVEKQLTVQFSDDNEEVEPGVPPYGAQGAPPGDR